MNYSSEFITEEAVSWLQSHGMRLKKGKVYVSKSNFLNNTFYCNFTYTNLTAPFIFVRILSCRKGRLRWPRSPCHILRCRASKVQEIDRKERWTWRWHEFFVGAIINFLTREFEACMVRLFSWVLLSLSGFTTKVTSSNFGAERLQFEYCICTWWI